MIRANQAFSTAVLLAVAASAGCGLEVPSPDRERTVRAVIGGPDLVAPAVSGPASARPGDSFEVAVTVCNQGDEFVGSGYVDARLSTDEIFDDADMPLGSADLGYLAPGQCRAQTIQAYAGTPEGVYFLGVVVDGGNYTVEVDEGNNTTSGGAFAVGHDADLVVTAVSGPASARPGDSFEVAVTVCNQGQGPAYGDVEVRLSADESIDLADMPVGMAPVSNLEPGQCRTVTVPGYANDYGAYYLGAVADPFDYTVELIESNNALAGSLMGIGHEPDLVVTAVSGPASARPGDSFEVAVTVCNQGQGPAYGDVEVRLSADESIDLADMPVGMAPVSNLEPGQCRTVTVPGYANDYGAYYLGAVADPFDYTVELIESNNALAGSLMGIGHEPDLVVTAVSGPASARPGDSFEVAVTVCNQGQGPAYSDVEVRLSQDAHIDLADMPVGMAPVSNLEPGQCRTVTVPGYANVPDYGAYYLGAVADPFDYTVELIESNNALAGSLIGIGHDADLVVTAVSGPASARPGDSFEVAVTVCNQGQGPAYSDVEVRLSQDAHIDLADLPVGMAPVSNLEPGQCSTVTVPGYANDYGAYYLGAVADPYNSSPELIESNNALAGSLMGIGHDADLVVTAVSGPASARPGDSFDVAVTVCNQGQGPAYSDVEVRLSQDAHIDLADLPVGMAPVSNLEPGQCRTVTVPGYANDYGAYYLGAVADPFDYTVELIESNNALAGSLIGIGHDADLVVTAVSGPASARPGDSFDVAVTVCNQGQGPAYGDVEVRLSQDAHIDLADMPVGMAPVSNLEPGQCRTVTVPGYANDYGAYYLGAVADPFDYTVELIESNNALAGSLMGIGHEPDLVVTAVSGPASARPGDSFDVAVTVCNQGQGPAYSDVEVRLSQDAHIDLADLPVGMAPVSNLEPGQCRTVTVPGYANDYGAYYLGAVADPFDYTVELIESNNALAGSLIGIGHDADLVVTAVSGPASARPGDSFDVAVTVCNQGQGPAYSDVEVRLSQDAHIDLADLPVGMAPVSNLEPGQCSTVTVPGYANVPDQGTYYLGAVADPYNYSPELIESNNAAAGNAITITY